MRSFCLLYSFSMYGCMYDACIASHDRAYDRALLYACMELHSAVTEARAYRLEHRPGAKGALASQKAVLVIYLTSMMRFKGKRA